MTSSSPIVGRVRLNVKTMVDGKPSDLIIDVQATQIILEDIKPNGGRWVHFTSPQHGNIGFFIEPWQLMEISVTDREA